MENTSPCHHHLCQPNLYPQPQNILTASQQNVSPAPGIFSQHHQHLKKKSKYQTTIKIILMSRIRKLHNLPGSRKSQQVTATSHSIPQRGLDILMSQEPNCALSPAQHLQIQQEVQKKFSSIIPAVYHLILLLLNVQRGQSRRG